MDEIDKRQELAEKIDEAISKEQYNQDIAKEQQQTAGNLQKMQQQQTNSQTKELNKDTAQHTHGSTQHSHPGGNKIHQHAHSGSNLKHDHAKHQHTEHHPKKRFSIKNTLQHIYEVHYKKLLIITLLMVLFSIGQVAYQMYSTSYYVGDKFYLGDFMKKGVSLKGGLSITINNDELDVSKVEINLLEKQLNNKFSKADISVREQTDLGQRVSISIEAAIENQQEIQNLKKFLEEVMPGLTKELIDKNTVAMGSTLGESFFKQTFKAMIIAFILMAIVVFIYFRQPVPSTAVLLAAFSDIITTLAIVNLMGMKLSTAGVAAFLMLIGYSVDTDILLSSRVLRSREGTILDRTYSAMKTGIVMTLTTAAAVLVAIIFSQSGDLTQIMIILFIGLMCDIPYTWIQNAGILRWYLEKHPLKHQ